MGASPKTLKLNGNRLSVLYSRRDLETVHADDVPEDLSKLDQLVPAVISL